MTDFPTFPGSLILATASDSSIPSPFMLMEPDGDDGPEWMHPDDNDPYRQSSLTLLGVLHDEAERRRGAAS